MPTASSRRDAHPALPATSADGVQLCCCDCGRLAGSMTHGTADFCTLIGWSYDSGVATCVRCQWLRGETPLLSRRSAVPAPEPEPAVRHALARMLAWLRGERSPRAAV
jgi:hypothetical protein